MRKGEVWFVEFPLEEDASRIINRPVIVLDENVLGVLSVKITKHKVRKEDPYDIPIIYWSEAGLRLASTARVSKVTVLNKDSFIFKIGNLHNDDMDRIEAMYSKFLEDNNIILLSSIISIVPTLSPFFTGAIILFILVLYVMFFCSSLFLFNMVMFSFGTISVVRVFPNSTFFFSIVVFSSNMV